MKQVCRNCIHLWGDECQYFPDMSIRVYSKSKSSCEHFYANADQGDKTWGGARPGAGRKPAGDDKRVQMVITIDRETRDKLKAMAKEMHLRVGRLIDSLVDNSPDFDF